MDYKDMVRRLLAAGGRESKNVQDVTSHPPIGKYEPLKRYWDPATGKYISVTESLVQQYKDKDKK